VDDVEQRDVGDGRRQHRVLDDLRIRDTHVFHHQEGRRAHHRRHDLAVDRAGHLDRAGLVSGKPTRFMSGMVKVPVVTTLAIELPEMMPVAADDTTAALAGPPRMWPSSAKALLMK
jgi:hypothetical protein